MGIEIYLFSWWRGKQVGQDQFGNRYFEEKKPRQGMRQRRWVVYNGQAEASKVPSVWHGWLHYTIANLPMAIQRHVWEKDHLPNLTGTSQAYKPKSWRSGRSSKLKLVQNYEPWKPEK